MKATEEVVPSAVWIPRAMATKSFGFHNYQIASVYSNKDLKPCKFYVRWFPSVVCLEKRPLLFVLFFFWTFQSSWSVGSLGDYFALAFYGRREASDCRTHGYEGHQQRFPGRRGLQESSFSPSAYDQRTPTPQRDLFPQPRDLQMGSLAGGRGLKEVSFFNQVAFSSSMLLPNQPSFCFWMLKVNPTGGRQVGQSFLNF